VTDPAGRAAQDSSDPSQDHSPGQPHPQAAARPHPGHHDAVIPGQQMILDLPRAVAVLDPRIAETLHAALDLFEAHRTGEQLAQVALACRRVLERLADALYPPRAETVGGRHFRLHLPILAIALTCWRSLLTKGFTQRWMPLKSNASSPRMDGRLRTYLAGPHNLRSAWSFVEYRLAMHGGESGLEFGMAELVDHTSLPEYLPIGCVF
jgi:hypothetical protein